jgi:hypothetical protein
VCAALAVTVLVAAVAAAPAGAATEVGETFDPQGGAFCSAGTTSLQSVSPQSEYAAPFAGRGKPQLALPDDREVVAAREAPDLELHPRR